MHLAFFSSLDEIADAKGEIFSGLEPGGVAVINSDIAQTDRLIGHARASQARVVLFGASERAEARLLDARLHADGSDVDAVIDGERLSYSLRNPGLHVAMNSLAVLVAAQAVGADLKQAAQSLSLVPPPSGRGARETLPIEGGAFTLIDESYNANPASMRAALDNLGRIAPGAQGRRIAVMGDMLELGVGSERFHRELAEAIESNRIDIVLACGPLMRALWDALPASRRGAYAETSDKLQPAALELLRAGDVMTIKGSLGSRMGPIVKAIRSRFAAPAAAQ